MATPRLSWPRGALDSPLASSRDHARALIIEAVVDEANDALAAIAQQCGGMHLRDAHEFNQWCRQHFHQWCKHRGIPATSGSWFVHGVASHFELTVKCPGATLGAL